QERSRREDVNADGVTDGGRHEHESGDPRLGQLQEVGGARRRDGDGGRGGHYFHPATLLASAGRMGTTLLRRRSPASAERLKARLEPSRRAPVATWAVVTRTSRPLRTVAAPSAIWMTKRAVTHTPSASRRP